MNMSLIGSLFLILAFVAANLPWFSDRFFFFFTPENGAKKAWMLLLEWLFLYFFVGLLALGIEKKITGVIHEKGWEFYSIGFCLFMIFAFPGFIYRNELIKYLKRK